MTRPHGNLPVPSCIINAEIAANQALAELGLTNTPFDATEQSAGVVTKLFKVVGGLAFLVGKKVAVTSDQHLIFQDTKLGYDEQNAQVAAGPLPGTFDVVLVTCFAEGDEQDNNLVNSLAIGLSSTMLSIEDGHETPQEISIKTLTRVRDITGFTVGLGSDLN